MEFGKFVEQDKLVHSTIRVNLTNSIVNVEYDEIEISYVDSGNGAGEPEIVTYKKDNSTVMTLTLSYDSDNNLIGVVRT